MKTNTIIQTVEQTIVGVSLVAYQLNRGIEVEDSIAETA
jgi:hypothetical protein